MPAANPDTARNRTQREARAQGEPARQRRGRGWGVLALSVLLVGSVLSLPAGAASGSGGSVTVSVAGVPRLTSNDTMSRVAVDEGHSYTYTIGLSSQPESGDTLKVVPYVSKSWSASATVSPAGGVTFTHSDWAAKTVTVTAAHDDDLRDGLLRISHRFEGDFSDWRARSLRYQSVEKFCNGRYGSHIDKGDAAGEWRTVGPTPNAYERRWGRQPGQRYFVRHSDSVLKARCLARNDVVDLIVADQEAAGYDTGRFHELFDFEIAVDDDDIQAFEYFATKADADARTNPITTLSLGALRPTDKAGIHIANDTPYWVRLRFRPDNEHTILRSRPSGSAPVKTCTTVMVKDTANRYKYRYEHGGNTYTWDQWVAAGRPGKRSAHEVGRDIAGKVVTTYIGPDVSRLQCTTRTAPGNAMRVLNDSGRLLSDGLVALYRHSDTGSNPFDTPMRFRVRRTTGELCPTQMLHHTYGEKYSTRTGQSSDGIHSNNVLAVDCLAPATPSNTVSDTDTDLGGYTILPAEDDDTDTDSETETRAAPDAATVTANGDGTLTVGWPSQTGATGYRVKVWGYGTVDRGRRSFSAGASDNWLDVTGLKPLGSYVVFFEADIAGQQHPRRFGGYHAVLVPSQADIDKHNSDNGKNGDKQTPQPPLKPAETIVTPTVTISGGAAVSEGGSASFTLTATPAPSSPLSVTVTVSHSGDYAAPGQTGARTVTIGTAGTATLTVATVDDATDEADGSITATVACGTGCTAGSPATATVAVSDNDDPPVPAVSVTGGGAVTEGGTATFTLTASPAPASALSVTVKIAQSGDYAASGQTGTKTLTIGTSGTATYTVATVDDAADETDGSITATVAAASGYTVGSPASGTVAVADNDPAPVPDLGTQDDDQQQGTTPVCTTADTALVAAVEAKATRHSPTGTNRADLHEMFRRAAATMNGTDTYTVADIKARPDKQGANWQGNGPNTLWQTIYTELDRLHTCRNQ